MDRVKDWEDKEVLTHTDLNTEFSNITDNIESGADVTDVTNVAEVIHGATTKSTPADNDELGLIDTAAENVLKKLTWTNAKATLKTYFDTLYNNYVHPNHSGEVTSVADGATTITDKAVTLAKMNDMATASILGRNTAATGVPEVLSKATTLSLLNVEDGADVTDATNVAAAGAVMDADFTAADEIMMGTGAGTHGQVTLAASQLLGKKAAGAAVNLTATEVRTILNVEDGADVTDTTSVDTAGAVMESDYNANTFLYAVSDNTPVVKTRAEVMALLSGQAAADFALNTHKITGVVDPTANQEAATKKYVDDNIGSADKILENNSSVEVVDAGTGFIKFILDDVEVARFTTPNILNMSNHKITNLLDPTSNQQAATKKYVDDAIVSTDIIEEGDTSVECIDAGTGAIIFKTDNVEAGRVADGKFSFGTTVSDYRLHVEGAAADGMIKLVNTQASEPGAGSGFLVYSDDGAALASGDRLGFCTFGGAEDGSHTLHNAAALCAYTSEAWLSTQNGSELRFEVTANGTTSRFAAMKILNSGILDMTTHKIMGVVDPTANQEVATKKYVDDNIGSGSVSDLAYDSTWNGVTGISPSKNAIWDWTKPYEVSVTAAPSSHGSDDSIGTAFTGDLDKLQFPVKHSISGAATLGQPASGYYYQNEAFPHFTYISNSSGWNQSTSSDSGRTGCCAYRTVISPHSGLGDAACYNGGVYVTGLKPGATSWLANAAGVIINGDVTAGANGVHLNALELNALGGAYDVAANSAVFNMYRNVDTAAKSEWWNAVRVQSKGTKSIESAFHLNGKALWGIDFTLATIANSAMVLKQDQKIEFDGTAGTYNASVDGGKYIKFDGSYIYINGTSKINGNLTVVNNIGCDAMNSTTLAANVHYFSAGNLSYVGSHITSSTHFDVTGQMRCDQFRIDQIAQAEVNTATHYITIEVNGVGYKVLLKST